MTNPLRDVAFQVNLDNFPHEVSFLAHRCDNSVTFLAGQRFVCYTDMTKNAILKDVQKVLDEMKEELLFIDDTKAEIHRMIETLNSSLQEEEPHSDKRVEALTQAVQDSFSMCFDEQHAELVLEVYDKIMSGDSE